MKLLTNTVYIAIGVVFLLFVGVVVLGITTVNLHNETVKQKHTISSLHKDLTKSQHRAKACEQAAEDMRQAAIAETDAVQTWVNAFPYGHLDTGTTQAWIERAKATGCSQVAGVEANS